MKKSDLHRRCTDVADQNGAGQSLFYKVCNFWIFSFLNIFLFDQGIYMSKY